MSLRIIATRSCSHSYNIERDLKDLDEHLQGARQGGRRAGSKSTPVSFRRPKTADRRVAPQAGIVLGDDARDGGGGPRREQKRSRILWEATHDNAVISETRPVFSQRFVCLRI